MSWRVTVQGYEAAQAALLKTIAAVQPDGAIATAVQYVVLGGQKAVAAKTPVQTGTLRASASPRYSGLYGEVAMADLVNPLRGGRTSAYGPIQEQKRGMYARTYSQDGPPLVRAAGELIHAELP